MPLVRPHQESFTGTVLPIVVPLTKDGRGPSAMGYEAGEATVTITVAGSSAARPLPSTIVYVKIWVPVVQPIGSYTSERPSGLMVTKPRELEPSATEAIRGWSPGSLSPPSSLTRTSSVTGAEPSRTVSRSFPTFGGSFVPATVIVKVCVAAVSTPPLAVPPSSASRHRDGRGAVGVGGRREGQRAGRRRSAGAAANRVGCVLAVTSKASAAGLVRAAGADRRGPAGHRLRPGVLGTASSRRPW